MISPANIKVRGPMDVTDLLSEGARVLELTSRGKYSGLTRSQCETVSGVIAKLLDRVRDDHNPYRTTTTLPDITDLVENLVGRCLGTTLQDLTARGDQKNKARKRAMVANVLMREGLCNQSQVALLFNRDRTTYAKVFRNHPTYMKNKSYREVYTAMEALASEWVREKSFKHIDKC